MIDVLLLRSIGRRRPSMERYADMLEHGVAPAEFRVSALRPPLTPLSETPGLSRLDRYLRSWIALPWALVRRRSAATTGPQVSHIVDHTFAHLIRLLEPQRTVITCHDLMRLKLAAGEVPSAGNRANPGRFRWSVSHLSRAAAVVCPSEATRDDVIRLCAVEPSRARVIPHCVEERFRPLSPERRRELRLELGPEHDHVLLHVSSGGFYKNIPVTLQVLARLRSQVSGVVLMRVGASLTAEEAALARRLGVADAVRDIGPVDDDRLADLYGTADLLLFPSLWEGFGWPVLEAMACATPVLTSRAPALVELVGDAGLIAEAGDANALAGAAQTLLCDPALSSRFSAAAQARAALFSAQRTRDAYADLWREVAAG